MSLTSRPPVQKGKKPPRSRGRARPPTKQEKLHWARVAALGCIVQGYTPCEGRVTIHHCGTGAGGRKDHSKVIGLCWGHHLGSEGIDGKRMSKRAWQDKYGCEEKLLKRTERRLKAEGVI